MGFFQRSQPAADGTTGWGGLFTSELYERRWFDAGQATSRVERNGREMTDPVPPGLRLIDDAASSKRFFAQASGIREPQPQAAGDYFEVKVTSTAANLSLTLGSDQAALVRRMAFTVLKFDGMLLLENFGAHPGLKQQYGNLLSATEDDDVVSLLGWWLGVAADDPSGGTSMWIHLSMDKAIRLGLEEAGILPRQQP